MRKRKTMRLGKTCLTWIYVIFRGVFWALIMIGPAVLATESSVAAGESPTDLPLVNGWQVTQDVRDFGEKQEWFKPEYKQDWLPISRLAHLQVLLAQQPYFGRGLRYFNEHAWWYRVEFSSGAIDRKATLRFGGVDYFAKVWLNGTLLGEHEGYADPFEFEVGKLLRTDRPNLLVVKVASPWDGHYRNESTRDVAYPFFSVERNLLKGSYEHSDGFVQRDVNPVGIWRPVTVTFHGDIHSAAEPTVITTLNKTHLEAGVKITWPVILEGSPRVALFVMRVRDPETGREVAKVSQTLRMHEGVNTVEAAAVVRNPKLWNTWDRGTPSRYQALLELKDASVLAVSTLFGIRQVELHRTADETRFFINGKPLYVRGTTYWSDLYLENPDRARYERDIRSAVRAGINAFRVHVHVENPDFYDLCDQLGIALLQDNELNWVFPSTAEFSARAVTHFGALVRMLKNHPSIIGWVAMNEIGFDPKFEIGHRSRSERDLGARLVAQAHQEDSTRPVIEDSFETNDLQSGDRHDYRGSLEGGTSTYFDIFSSKDKLVTEFGVDAPPALTSLRAIPEAAERLKDVMPRVSDLHDYQYHLLKYYIEHYRIQKYAPNAGYFQFMWIDFSPQSFYGIYDYWGVPKSEGLGGGLRALRESNQPIGIFMEHDTKPVALHVVNDSSADLGNCVVRWRVSTATQVIAEDSQPVQLGPDSHQKIRDLNFAVKAGETYEIVLDLLASNGRTLAHNMYVNPFEAVPLPKGYPDRIDDELGMRLWWAGEEK